MCKAGEWQRHSGRSAGAHQAERRLGQRVVGALSKWWHGMAHKCCELGDFGSGSSGRGARVRDWVGGRIPAASLFCCLRTGSCATSYFALPCALRGADAALARYVRLPGGRAQPQRAGVPCVREARVPACLWPGESCTFPCTGDTAKAGSAVCCVSTRPSGGLLRDPSFVAAWELSCACASITWDVCEAAISSSAAGRLADGAPAICASSALACRGCSAAPGGCARPLAWLFFALHATEAPHCQCQHSCMHAQLITAPSV